MSSRHNIKIIAGAIVCQEAKLRGDVTIGANTIVHPSCTISAEAGPIIIGERCLIEEQSKITHRVPFDKVDSEVTPVLIIGSNNVFELDCNVEACKIGDNNIFESKCFVGNKVTVTNGCIIGAGCQLTEEQVLPENTIVYGAKCHQREALQGPGIRIDLNLLLLQPLSIGPFWLPDWTVLIFFLLLMFCPLLHKANALGYHTYLFRSIYGRKKEINIYQPRSKKQQTLQMDTLSKVLPNYHRVRKANAKN